AVPRDHVAVARGGRGAGGAGRRGAGAGATRRRGGGNSVRRAPTDGPGGLGDRLSLGGDDRGGAAGAGAVAPARAGLTRGTGPAAGAGVAALAEPGADHAVVVAALSLSAPGLRGDAGGRAARGHRAAGAVGRGGAGGGPGRALPPRRPALPRRQGPVDPRGGG